MQRQIQKKNKQRLNLDHIDIREVLDDLGIFYTESGKNVSDGWIGVTCPLPGCDDTSNHLGVCLDSPVISCFACGQKGNYLTYLKHELGSYSKAIAILEKHIPDELKRKEQRENKRAVKVFLPEEASENITVYHKQFIRSRNFNWKKLQRDWGFQYCGPIGDWANRIIVPVYRNRMLITFTSIDIATKSKMRYKHLKKEKSIIPIKNYLVGIEHTKKNVVVVVEGLLDMFRIGFGAVCTSGAQTTAEQIEILSKYQRVIILFDGDSAGRKAAEKLSMNLSAFTEVIVIDLPDDIDPDIMEKKDIIEIQRMLGRG